MRDGSHKNWESWSAAQHEAYRRALVFWKPPRLQARVSPPAVLLRLSGEVKEAEHIEHLRPRHTKRLPLGVAPTSTNDTRRICWAPFFPLSWTSRSPTSSNRWAGATRPGPGTHSSCATTRAIPSAWPRLNALNKGNFMQRRWSVSRLLAGVIFVLESAQPVAATDPPPRPLSPSIVAVAPNGSLFIADLVRPGIFRRDATGSLDLFAPGRPQQRTPLHAITAMAVGRDGTLFAADRATGEVYRVEAGKPPVPLSNGGFEVPTGLAVLPPKAT